ETDPGGRMRVMIRRAIGAGSAAGAILLFLVLLQASLRGAKLPGMATLTGTVESPKPFKAAQVYLRNIDRRMTYVVSTSAGKYRAVALLPGVYEITVDAKGMMSAPLRLSVKADEDAVAP